MKNIKSKKNIFIITFLLVISSTVAYLYSTDTFQNIFIAASYKVTVVETFESPDNWKPGDTTPKTATLKNEGTVPIKVRVKFEEEWKDSNNQDLPLKHNGENVAIINFSNQDDYIYKDGYYYYDLPLNPGETTSSIIESVTFNPNYSGTITCIENDDSTHTCSSSESGYEGGTYKLTLTIEGVQEDYYVQAWGLSGVVERQYLYDVLKKETESGGLAREYSGDHHDSFTEEPSQKIYHWYASNDSQGTQILNKNNVIFANHCWQMIRTTDTGGVKMIYNGEVEDGKCLSTRENHLGYNSTSPQNLNSNYWYGTDYKYDSVQKTFKLDGTTEQATWNTNTWSGLIGKYTCKKTSIDESCSTLYLVESFKKSTEAYTIPLSSNSAYSQFGATKFNIDGGSVAFVGYKIGDIYKYASYATIKEENFSKKQNVLSSTSLDTTYWYSDSISYDSTTGNYSLVSPYQVGSTTDYPSLVGKYTFRNSDNAYTNTSVYYISGVSDSTMYYKSFTGGNLLSNYNILFSDTITDNGDGTYSLDNPISVSLSDWYTNNESYNNKYTCGNTSASCTVPRYLVGFTSLDYTYIMGNEKIMIGKSREGTTLIDTLLVRKDELIKNSSNYSDYKYTCNNTSTTCTEANLRMIKEYSITGYNYLSNHYFSNSVTWDGTKYTLVNPIGMENQTSINNIGNHHYMCLGSGAKTCSTVAYIYHFMLKDKLSLYYITLKDGVVFPSEALERMLTKNLTNSTIKLAIESWYKHFMLNYDYMLEDTIFCNDRSISSLGGWDQSANIINGYSGILHFKEYNSTSDLSCTNITDRFSVSNNDAKLDFKVGLMSNPEFNILNNNNVRKTGQKYWSISPYYYGTYVARSRINSVIGGIDTEHVYLDNGVRPAISIKPGTEYYTGDGSKQNPYIVKTE